MSRKMIRALPGWALIKPEPEPEKSGSIVVVQSANAKSCRGVVVSSGIDYLKEGDVVHISRLAGQVHKESGLTGIKESEVMAYE